MFHRSKSSLDAESKLAAGKPGDIIDCQEMESLLQLPCRGSQTKGFKVVASVIPMVERDHKLVWRWDSTGKFWRCATNADKPGLMAKSMKEIHRKAKRFRRIGSTVDYDALPDVQKREAIAASMLLNVIDVAASGVTRRSLALLADKKPATIDESQVLRMVLEKRGGENGK